MREHHDALGPGCVVVCTKQPATFRPDTKHVEMIRGDHLTEHEPRSIAQRERGKHRRVTDGVREHRVLGSDLERVRVRRRGVHVTIAATGEDIDKRRGILDRQRAQEQRVNKREHRGVRADAETERKDGDRGKARAPQKPAKGVADVLHA